MEAFKAYAWRVLPFCLYILHMVTSVRLCRYRAWKEAGAPTPFVPRGVQSAAKRITKSAENGKDGETVIRHHGAERSRPCRRISAFITSRVNSTSLL